MPLIRNCGERLSLALTCALLLCQPLVIEAQEGRRMAGQESGRASGQDGGRIRPPGAVTCDRNNLTAYTGRVVSYSRRAGRITMTIDTDYDTTETVTLRYKSNSSPARWFLLRGERFKASDWARVESAKSRLLPEMRVTAWVCNDGRQPIIDWQPPTGDGPAPPSTP
jgi:hypothetical protein